jgi:hypothetical protein
MCTSTLRNPLPRIRGTPEQVSSLFFLMMLMPPPW